MRPASKIMKKDEPMPAKKLPTPATKGELRSAVAAAKAAVKAATVERNDRERSVKAAMKLHEASSVLLVKATTELERLQAITL